MSVVSSICCYRGTGYGMPIEVGAGKITGVRGESVWPVSRSAARTCVSRMGGRFIAGMYCVLGTRAKGLTSSGQGAA